MKLKVLWPGGTKSREIKKLQAFYIEKIRKLSKLELIETREARGIDERNRQKILKIEAEGLEKHLDRDYIICLSNKGKSIDSIKLAGILEKKAMSYPYPISFVVGGFLGLGSEILDRADFVLSLSSMTFSHELARIVLLEQIYRSLTIINGKNYAK
ncbi:MAG: 23S rRNA (pseudouridine(1915)-N(3))-methyltransferase RlmH [Candidatus Aminicenantes bacterium]|nr:23S rRNA (pseudouridine(1915)-N(3))-methyltransferase RlmH [Candidatus Aminicenantes bacterium]